MRKKAIVVDQAISKEEALEKINESSYPVIMLDLKMPGVKGLELLQSIRERRPEAMVVIITGYASIETAVETARMGAVGYLAKPFTPDEIRGAADDAVRLQHKSDLFLQSAETDFRRFRVNVLGILGTAGTAGHGASAAEILVRNHKSYPDCFFLKSPNISLFSIIPQ